LVVSRLTCPSQLLITVMSTPACDQVDRLGWLINRIQRGCHAQSWNS
jgi:hypothetical protein